MLDIVNMKLEAAVGAVVVSTLPTIKRRKKKCHSVEECRELKRKHESKLRSSLMEKIVVMDSTTSTNTIIRSTTEDHQ